MVLLLNIVKQQNTDAECVLFLFSNDYSRAVGEEYLKFFDFTGQPLDHALR